MVSKRLTGCVMASSALLALAGCGDAGKGQQQAPQAPPPVGYVVAHEEPVALTTELPGRTTAYETSEVRPQVNGLVLARLFVEGDVVRKGQPLYRIDPSPYQAQVASARAALARARSSIASSTALARRYGELVKINAIARQEFENAQTSAAQAQADVAAQQAALRSAQIDLGRTTIRAPITGRIGRSLFTTGALVSAAQANPLATIQRIDPIYVDIQQSSADLLKLRRQIMSGQLTRNGDAKVKLKLEDGSEYGPEGSLRFADVTVDPTTGSQVIRALIPNSGGLLLPGMFVRASLAQGTAQKAILVPQRAVGRDEKGQATVMVIGNDGKVQVRSLQTSRVIGENWLVSGGINPGDKIIVEGGMMLRPGMPVQGHPFDPNAKPAGGPPPSGPAQAQAK
ncbi:efflux RND transporter periplasmic adaptor subunit [Sphingomonas sp. BK580]|uniref:efflux RND transporter periplasmic adaptor subunit n=1 Tax=Sphingomonas sp. BK580 TaxID=2586972 RepID=UPI00160FCE84|nr:efflux RND transporter periplasmic adaptor subunit [Sphingomonas sp. BK580]